MNFISSLLINGLIVLVISWMFDSIYVADYLTAIGVGFVLGLINFTIRPILTILTLPLTILTFGIFLLILNGMMVLLVDWLIPGFRVEGLGSAILFIIFLGIFNYFVQGQKRK